MEGLANYPPQLMDVSLKSIVRGLLLGPHIDEPSTPRLDKSVDMSFQSGITMPDGCTVRGFDEPVGPAQFDGSVGMSVLVQPVQQERLTTNIPSLSRDDLDRFIFLPFIFFSFNNFLSPSIVLFFRSISHFPFYQIHFLSPLQTGKVLS